MKGKARIVGCLLLCCICFLPAINVDAVTLEEAKEAYENEEAGFIEIWISSFYYAGGVGYEVLMDAAGVPGLTDLILGNPAEGETVSSTTFSFEVGNPYGTIAALSFSLIRRMVLVLMFYVCFYRIVRMAWTKGSGQEWAQFKEDMSRFVLTFLLLFLMPVLFDIGLEIKTEFLSNFSTALNSALGSGEMDIVDHYREAAAFTFRITNTLMYLGALAITFFFLFEYVGMAFSTMLLFIIFPFIAIMGNFDKTLLGTWGKNVVSLFITPVMDYMLLCVPLMFAAFFPDAWLIKLTLCMTILPTRNAIKVYLGMNSPGSGILSGMSAIMAGRAIASLAVGVATGAATAVGNIKSGRDDATMADTLDAMEEAKAYDERDAMEQAGFVSTGTASQMDRNGIGMHQEKEQRVDDADIMSQIQADRSDQYQERTAEDADVRSQMQADQADTLYQLQNQKSKLVEDTSRRKARVSSLHGQRDALQDGMKHYESNSASYQAGQEELAGLNQALAEEYQDIEKNERALEGLTAHMGALGRSGGARSGIGRSPELVQDFDQAKEQLVQRKEGLEADTNARRQRIAFFQGEKARVNQTVATASSLENDGGVAQGKERIGKLDEQIADENAVIYQNASELTDIGVRMQTLDSKNIKSQGGERGFATHQQEVLDARANIRNFESPQFQNMSGKRKAELLRQRARGSYAKAAGGVVGGIAGGVALGGIGVGSGLMYGPAVTATAGSSFALTGGTLGATGVGGVSSWLARNVGYGTVQNGTPNDSGSVAVGSTTPTPGGHSARGVVAVPTANVGSVRGVPTSVSGTSLQGYAGAQGEAFVQQVFGGTQGEKAVQRQMLMDGMKQYVATSHGKWAEDACGYNQQVAQLYDHAMASHVRSKITDAQTLQAFNDKMQRHGAAFAKNERTKTIFLALSKALEETPVE